MSKSLRICLCALLCLVCAFGAFGCTTKTVEQSKEPLSAQVDDSELVKPKTLTVGVLNNKAPFSMVVDNSQVEGIDVDLAAALADELGLQLQVVAVNNGDNALSAHKVDIMMTATPDMYVTSKAKLVGHYNDNAPALFTKTTSNAVVKATEQDLLSGTIGVQEGSVTWSLLKSRFANVKMKTYKTVNAAFDGLKNGEVKYVACDAHAGAYLATSYENVNFAGALDLPSAYAVAVADGKKNLQTKVQAALDNLVHNGVLDLIRAKWMGNLPVIKADAVVLVNKDRLRQDGVVGTQTDPTQPAQSPHSGDEASGNTMQPGSNVPAEGNAPASESR